MNLIFLRNFNIFFHQQHVYNGNKEIGRRYDESTEGAVWFVTQVIITDRVCGEVMFSYCMSVCSNF